MFSPKVLKMEPQVERTLMTLLGRGWCRVVVVVVGPGSWAETMYCSLRTSLGCIVSIS